MSVGHAHAWYVWLSIAGISLTTFLTRGSFLILGARARLPLIVDRALAYAPACALAAIVAPDVAYLHGDLRLDLANPRLLGAAVATLGFAATRSLVVTIAAGMAAYTVFRLWL